MKDERHFTKIINWAKRKGFRNIKANIDDFESPTSYSRPSEDATFTPDLTAKKRTKKSYFEIATKAGETKRKVTKWKLMSTLAAMKGGKLFLLAPKGHKAFTQRVIDKYNLNAELVYLPSL